MISVLGGVLLTLVAAAAVGVVVVVRPGGRPGPWLGGAGLATVAVYLYGAAESLGGDISVASWSSVAMAVLVVAGLLTLLVGRSRAARVVVMLSAAAIALGAVGVALTVAGN